MRRILVPTDFSANANHAVKYAIQFAKKTNSEILFFHSVYSPVDDDLVAASDPEKQDVHKAEKKLRNEIIKLYKKQRIPMKQNKIAFVVKLGDSAVRNILDTVKENKIDFIILGTHGATGLKKVLFGSNTSHLISKADIPVLAIPMRFTYQPVKEIIYATDLENVKQELKVLKPISKQLKAKIVSVHFDYGWAKDKKELNNIKIIQASKTNYHVQKITLETPFLKPLHTYIKKRKHAIVCMFHGQKSGLAKLLLSSNTEGLAMGLKVPLLSI